MLRGAVSHIASAVTVLTALVVPEALSGARTRRAVAWFPLVGLGIGVLGWSLLVLVSRVGHADSAPVVVAAAVVSLWAVLTRMTPWDGLSRYSSAVWGAPDAEGRLRHMRNATVSAAAVVSVSLVIVLQTSSVAVLLGSGHLAVVAVAPMFGRLAMVCAAWLGAPARSEGFAASLLGRPSIPDVVIATVTIGLSLLALWAGYGSAAAILGVVGVASALVVPHVLSESVKGVTGDVMGAATLVTETVLLGVSAVWLG